MGSVACEFSLSPASPSDPPSPHSEPLFPRPRVSPDLNSRFLPSTATGSEARSTEFTTAGGQVRRFKIGDMVWGAVKSHPWWPGQIFDEACALPIVRRSKVDGHVLVAFFGDSSYGWLDPSDLLPFEPHFPDLSQQVGSPSFVNAVIDAVDEVNRRAALGFVCCRRIPFHPTRVPGYVTVDVPGYEPGVYSMVQIEEARERILPSELFSIMNELAVTPQRKEEVSVDRIRRKALLLAYRRSVFEEVDQAYDEAFGRKTGQPKILNIRVVLQKSVDGCGCAGEQCQFLCSLCLQGQLLNDGGDTPFYWLVLDGTRMLLIFARARELTGFASLQSNDNGTRY